MSQPWERQEGETPKAFAAFCAYRDMGPGRSLEKYARTLGGKWQEYSRIPSHVNGWSSQNKWPERAAAYDSHLDSIRVSSVGRGIAEDRVTYRDSVKREAADFALSAIAMRREAMLMEDKATASQVLARAAGVWEKARQVEGIALGLVVE